MDSTKSLTELTVDHLATSLAHDLYTTSPEEVQSIFASLGFDVVPPATPEYIRMLGGALEQETFELITGKKVSLGGNSYQFDGGDLIKTKNIAKRKGDKLSVLLDILAKEYVGVSVKVQQVSLTASQLDRLEAFVGVLDDLYLRDLDGIEPECEFVTTALGVGSAQPVNAELPYSVYYGCRFAECADEQPIGMVVFSVQGAVAIEGEVDISIMRDLASRIGPYLYMKG
ncbi:hypothetical protein [Vibrio owensii]|uniref:hypothetical protein n=1 Tax=Vibrio owensii TaxID=696485 RepID=UPI0018F18A34|nr:hypothetical protein [Vibrio owensii]